MRILLITDTHGDLDIINELIERERADACIHCGDFGLYDKESVERLSLRELRLRLKHSDLPHEIRERAWTVSPDELRQTIRDHHLLDGFVPYIKGTKKFAAPIYAVWGNHEDAEVVRQFRRGKLAVENLQLLDERSAADLAPYLRVIGLGGNFYLEGIEGLFASDLHGRGGKVRSSLVQYARLWQRELQRHDDRITIFVSHVSPGKARILERLCLLMGVRLCLSGHMGPPVTQTYSLFAICEPHQALARSEDDLRALIDAFHSVEETLPKETRLLLTEMLQRLHIEPLADPGRGNRASPNSVLGRYFGTQFVNLADAPHAWSILDINDERHASLTHHATWPRPL